MSRLLDLPHDLLIQEILSRLPWPTLSQCLLVSKSLWSAITSSPILIYHRALFLASMVDNPRCSLSLPEKLEMLREREERWKRLEPTVVVETKQDSGRGEWLSVAAEDGAIIYANMKGGSVNLGMFPSSLGGEMKWNDIPFEGQDEAPIGFCTAIDESDLVAVGFRNKTDGTVDVHLVQYTSKSPHSLASQPIIHTGLFPLAQSSGEIGIAGNVLGVILSPTTNPTESSENSLQLWDWKSGRLIGETTVESQSFIFLAEDLFIVPSNFIWGFQFYHITPSSEVTIRPIGFLHFPPLSESIWEAHIDTWFQPIRLPSPTHTHTPLISSNVPFSDDSSKTLIFVRMRIVLLNSGRTVYFPMIVQRDRLFEYARGFLSSYQMSGEGENTIEWEKWGPGNTRILGPERHWQDMVAVSGTRWLHVHHPPGRDGGLSRHGAVIQIMDFGVPKVRRCLARLEQGLDPIARAEEEEGKREEGEDEESEYTAHVEFLHSPIRIDHSCFGEPIITHLPCIQSTLLLKARFMPTLPLSIQLGVRDDAWKRVRGRGDREDTEDTEEREEREDREDKEEGWERFTGTLWDTEYLSGGCVAGAKTNGDLSLLYFG